MNTLLLLTLFIDYCRIILQKIEKKILATFESFKSKIRIAYYKISVQKSTP